MLVAIGERLPHLTSCSSASPPCYDVLGQWWPISLVHVPQIPAPSSRASLILFPCLLCILLPDLSSMPDQLHCFILLSLCSLSATGCPPPLPPTPPAVRVLGHSGLVAG